MKKRIPPRETYPQLLLSITTIVFFKRFSLIQLATLAKSVQIEYVHILNHGLSVLTALLNKEKNIKLNISFK